VPPIEHAKEGRNDAIHTLEFIDKLTKMSEPHENAVAPALIAATQPQNVKLHQTDAQVVNAVNINHNTEHEVVSTPVHVTELQLSAVSSGDQVGGIQPLLMTQTAVQPVHVEPAPIQPAVGQTVHEEPVPVPHAIHAPPVVAQPVHIEPAPVPHAIHIAEPAPVPQAIHIAQPVHIEPAPVPQAVHVEPVQVTQPVHVAQPVQVTQPVEVHALPEQIAQPGISIEVAHPTFAGPAKLDNLVKDEITAGLKSISVSEEHLGQPVLPERPPAKPRQFAVAEWDHAPLEANEISFSANSIIEIIAMPNEDWWEGKVVSNDYHSSGLFPANRVRLLQDVEAAEALKQTLDDDNPFATLNSPTQKVHSPSHITPLGDIPTDASASDSSSSVHSPDSDEDLRADEPEESALIDDEGSPLPAFWRRAAETDAEHPDTSKTYYYNVKTHETSWTIPGKSAHEIEEAGLLDGWKAAVDEAGSVYYFCEETGETSWDKPVQPILPPRRVASVAQPAPVPVQAAPLTVHQNNAPPLPPVSTQPLPPILFPEGIPHEVILRSGPASLRLEKGSDAFMKKDWKAFQCVLLPGVLAYFKLDATPNQIRGFVLLEGASLAPAEKQTKKKGAMVVTCKNGVEFLFLTKDDNELKAWADGFINACSPSVPNHIGTDCSCGQLTKCRCIGG
jgi:hypothetical protein